MDINAWYVDLETRNKKSEIMIITNVTVKIPASCQFMKLIQTSCWKSLNLFFGIYAYKRSPIRGNKQIKTSSSLLLLFLLAPTLLQINCL